MPIGGERRAAFEHDREHVEERLDVVDHGRLAEQPALDGERGLVARLAPVALDRAEDRGLLAADVGACALADLDVEREVPAKDVVAQVAVARAPARARARGAAAPAGTRRAGRCSRARQPSRTPRSSSPRSPRTDPLEDDAVLERARLGLIGVADHVMRAGRVAGATASHLRRSGTRRRRGPSAPESVSSRITPSGPSSIARRSAS